MKIALVNPDRSACFDSFCKEAFIEPLGLLYLSSVLLEDGHRTTVIDQRYHHLDGEEVFGLIERFSPDAAGISITYANHQAALDFIAAIKRRWGIPIILGGCYPTAHPEMALVDGVDLVVTGEGEETMKEIASRLKNGLPLAGIAGTARNESGKLVLEPMRARIQNLDALPFPDRRFSDPRSTDLRLAVPMGPRTRALCMVTSRGCGNRCGFCSSHYMWGGKWIGRSPENVVREIIGLRKEFGAGMVLFLDEEINFDRDRSMALYRLIKEEAPWLRFVAESSPPFMDLEMAKAMADAGLAALFIGFESGAPSIIRHLGKKYDPARALEVVKYLQKRRVFISGTFMLGLPWESAATLRETLRFACKLNLDFNAFIFHRPQYGTPFYNLCKSKKLLVDENYDESSYPLHLPATRSFFLSAEEIGKANTWFHLVTLGRPDYHLRLFWRMMLNPDRFWAHLRYLSVAVANAVRIRQESR